MGKTARAVGVMAQEAPATVMVGPVTAAAAKAQLVAAKAQEKMVAQMVAAKAQEKEEKAHEGAVMASVVADMEWVEAVTAQAAAAIFVRL